MLDPVTIVKMIFLTPLALLIAYHDVRYRRIPNLFVLATLISGLIINSTFSGFSGTVSGLEGCALAFGLMFMMHIIGAMGAGDVKLFAAVGAVVGVSMVVPTFLVVAITGGVLAVYSMLRAGAMRSTMNGVLQIFVGLLPGWHMPRFAVPADRRHTIPYGVAITIGSLLSLIIFHA